MKKYKGQPKRANFAHWSFAVDLAFMLLSFSKSHLK